MTAITLPTRGVIVLVGAAGSGKSTLAARLFAPDEVLASDAFRARISGDERDQRVTGAAFRALGRALDRRLAAGQRAVIDATNLRPAERRPWLRAARTHGVPAVAIVLHLPHRDVRRQGRTRARVVDPAVVDRHLDSMARLSTAGGAALRDEGFDVVLWLTSAEEARALEAADRPDEPAAGRLGQAPSG